VPSNVADEAVLGACNGDHPARIFFIALLGESRNE
jgi:hypothetical protein